MHMTETTTKASGSAYHLPRRFHYLWANIEREVRRKYLAHTVELALGMHLTHEVKTRAEDNTEDTVVYSTR